MGTLEDLFANRQMPGQMQNWMSLANQRTAGAPAAIPAMLPAGIPSVPNIRPGAIQAAATQQAAQRSGMLGATQPGIAQPQAAPAGIGAIPTVGATPPVVGGYHVSGGGADYDVTTPGAGISGSALAGGLSGIIGGLGSLLGGDDDMSSAIGGANDVYQKYLNEALQKLQQEEGQSRQDITGQMAPYTQAGQQALQEYMGTLGMRGGAAQQTATDQFRASPGYQFALKQGLQATQRGMGAEGLEGSGAEMKALQQTGQGMADQEYGKWQSQLAGLAGRGQQAAQFTGGSLAQLGLGFGGDISKLYGTMGQAQAEAQMAQAQAEQAQDESSMGGLGSMIGAGISLMAL